MLFRSFDDHLNKVNLALTNSGSTKSRLTLIKNRVEEQQTTIEELKSTNEDRDISDIIIDFYAMYNAYQSSLTESFLSLFLIEAAAFLPNTNSPVS